MPNKKPPNFLSKDEVVAAIQEKDATFKPLKKALKPDLLAVAKRLNAISEEQIADSVQQKYHVVKLYMRSILRRREYEQRIEDYVLCHSKLFVRATRLQNLAVQRFLGVPNGPLYAKRTEFHFQITGNMEEDPAYMLYGLIYNGSTSDYLFQCYLAEMVPQIKRDATIQHCLSTRQYELEPPQWEGVMNRTGWRKACEKYSSQMRGNLTTTIKKRVMKHVGEYVASLQANIEKDELKKLLYKKWPALEDLPSGLFENTRKTIKDVRSALGIKDSNAVPKKLKGKITPKLFCLYVHLAMIGMIKKPLLPFSTYNRKFAYFDSKIAHALFPKSVLRGKRILEDKEGKGENPENEENSENRLQDIFDFTTTSARSRKRVVQKKRRDLARRRKKTPKKKCRVDKRKHGTSPFIKDKYVSSVLTDGVSICVRVKQPKPLPAVPGRVTRRDPKPEDKLRADLERYRAEDAEEPVFIGVDYGRAKLYTAASQFIDGTKLKTTTFTRRKYYYEIGYAKRARWERERREANQDVISALQDMSWAGKQHDIDQRVQVERAYRETLMTEFINSKDKARWRMMAYRWKRSSLDRASNRLIDSIKRKNNQRLVIGVGNGSFPSTRKGEKAVPTKKFKEHLRRAIYRRQYEARMRHESKPITLIDIDEFRTTKCCYQCEVETTSATIEIPGIEKVVVSTRLRLCTNCILKIDKLCDRDVNAARNIFRLTICKYNGEERPEFQRKPLKENNEEADDTDSLVSSDSEDDSSQFSD